jgi:class 3 adenylate cyclase
MMMVNFFIKMSTLFLTLIRYIMIFLVLLTLLGIVKPYVSNLKSYRYLEKVLSYEQTVNTSIKNTIPTTISGYDISRIMALIVLIILIDLTRNLTDRLRFYKHKQRMSIELNTIKETYTSANQDTIALLESKIEQASLASGKNRQDLLKEFASLKRELEKIGRDLTFLAIDVVDSTGMKVGEDRSIVEHDFHAYHDYIEAKFKEHGVIKAAWTPDGVMGCFNNIENAVQAAESIINGLEYFNKNVKGMKKDFAIRCGINAGHVYYDDSIPLEHFSDRTIDIAGHMQKHAPINSILIAKQMIAPVKNQGQFEATERVVDGLEVCQWVKK